MALTADGKVFSWGDGEMGQLGHGDNQCVCRSIVKCVAGRAFMCNIGIYT